jgi:hypothetical protein
MDHEEKGPCWKGYKQIGTKMKNGKEVPNCVPADHAEIDVKNYSEEHGIRMAHGWGVGSSEYSFAELDGNGTHLMPKMKEKSCD